MASATIEEYLEMVYRLDQKGGPVIGARLAEAVGVSAPTVTQTLKRMVKDGYVHIERPEGDRAHACRYGAGALDPAAAPARGTPTEPTSRLRLAPGACRGSEVPACSLARGGDGHFPRTLGDPLTCPHGNRSPAISRRYTEEATALARGGSRWGDGDRAAQSPRMARRSPNCSATSTKRASSPARAHRARNKRPTPGPVTVRKDGHEMALGVRAAQELLVAPV